jgi:hypothetical protein
MILIDPNAARAFDSPNPAQTGFPVLGHHLSKREIRKFTSYFDFTYLVSAHHVPDVPEFARPASRF